MTFTWKQASNYEDYSTTIFHGVPNFLHSDFLSKMEDVESET